MASPRRPSARADGAAAPLPGYPDNTFRPGEDTLHAQTAALIARAMGWAGEERSDHFSDRGAVDAAL